VLKFSYLTDKIISFLILFNGIKRLEFKNFCKIVDILKDKGHLTTKGIEKIFKIKDKEI